MRERLRLAVRGAVQGVGFRPFVYRLATSLDLAGWVLNAPDGVIVEVEGTRDRLTRFRAQLSADPPPHALILSVEPSWLDSIGYDTFEIRKSRDEGDAAALVLPDLATCEACRAELFDPGDRRHRYPFINCTHCGPRFSIIDALPYDRARTSMRGFTMCPDCEREYRDPANRRFHAQPNACSRCGPQMAWWNAHGVIHAERDDAVVAAVIALRRGEIVAVKGVGGFHLMVDARQSGAVRRLRERKHREEKPFAVMYPSIDAIRQDCDVSPGEARLLTSAEAPIVLLRRRSGAAAVADDVAPCAPTLGVMLPPTPLHHLLAHDLGVPVVATSGNRSDEPICIDEHEAIDRLFGIADGFLVHNRPIVRHVDDSIVRIVAGRELMLRRARGYAPLPVRLRTEAPALVAVGAHLKNAIAVTSGCNVFVSQHLGDLETPQAADAFERVMRSLAGLFHAAPSTILADMHPDYFSTRYARASGLPVVTVQHHLAHIAACMAENDLATPALGVAWDGTGYGPDGTIWGGEFLRVGPQGWQRAACLRPFRLPGGEQAVREPRRSALGVLHEIGLSSDSKLGPIAIDGVGQTERRLLEQALERGINAPVTTSAGRLFDAVAALIGLRARSAFEGQAAMLLEWAADSTVGDAYPFELVRGAACSTVGSWEAPPVVVDWIPTIRALVGDKTRGVPLGVMAARFHETLARTIVAVAKVVGEPRVVLSGGCFQNRLLLERAIARLRDAGFAPAWPQRIPPNDGGIAVGQIAAYANGLAGPAKPATRIETHTSKAERGAAIGSARGR